MNVFQKIKIKKPGKNVFDLSHEKKMSLIMGNLIPIFHQEILPGDKFNVSSEILLRFAPMLAPMMHRVNVYTHYFFVPNRLIWDEWEEFITGGPDGTLTPVPPYVPYNNDYSDFMTEGSLSDYFGLPPVGTGGSGSGLKVSTLPFRAYQLIFNEYYRDQNLSNPVSILKTSGFDGNYDQMMAIRKRAWEKDYFTSALPWAQRGSTVGIPLSPDEQGKLYKTSDGTLYTPGSTKNLQVNGAGGLADQDLVQLSMDPGSTINVNDLRTAVKLQEWLENNARAGARYIEQILSHFAVKSSDARLQRPEYLGGGVQPVVISEVLSTVGTTAEGIEAPQANMAGHGISVGRTNKFSKYFEEHGQVIGILSILPRTAYQNGIPREFLREDKTDYYWPEFAHLGEQPVLKGEIFYDPAASETVNKSTWGYQQRYAEYKYKPSTVHGAFRSTLDFWHMGRKFTALPDLNESFVTSDPTTRIFAVTEDVEQIYAQVYNSVQAVRPIPYFGVPQL